MEPTVGSKWVCKVDNPLNAGTLKNDLITVTKVCKDSEVVDYYISDPDSIWLADLGCWYDYFKPWYDLTYEEKLIEYRQLLRDSNITVPSDNYVSIEADLSFKEHLLYTPKDIKTKDNVNSPSHYGQGKIEAIEYIKDFLTDDEYVGYLRGNIAKYMHRFRYKNGVEDLRKAEWYLKRLIETQEG